MYFFVVSVIADWIPFRRESVILKYLKVFCQNTFSFPHVLDRFDHLYLRALQADTRGKRLIYFCL